MCRIESSFLKTKLLWNSMIELKSTTQLVNIGFWQKMDINSKEIIVERLEIVQIKNKLYNYIANTETYNVM